jgi:hypothetical protein
MSLKTNALLVSVNITQWTGRKFDKRATGTVEATHATDQGVGNFTKKLLPGAAELEAIQSAAWALRKFFYENTLPWAADGARIVSSQNYFPFTQEFRKRKAEFDAHVAAFLTEYPRLQDAARRKLGDLFSESEYPEITRLAAKFRCEMAIFPVPDIGDFRVEISDAEKQVFLDSMARVERDALNDCYKRLLDVVSKAAERLKQPDAVFRESLIGNIVELVELLPRLNPIDDPKLEALRAEVQSVVSKVSAESIRASETTRADTAKQLEDIASKMDAFMGGAQ